MNGTALALVPCTIHDGKFIKLADISLPPTKKKR